MVSRQGPRSPMSDGWIGIQGTLLKKIKKMYRGERDRSRTSSVIKEITKIHIIQLPTSDFYCGTPYSIQLVRLTSFADLRGRFWVKNVDDATSWILIRFAILSPLLLLSVNITCCLSYKLANPSSQYVRFSCSQGCHVEKRFTSSIFPPSCWTLTLISVDNPDYKFKIPVRSPYS